MPGMEKALHVFGAPDMARSHDATSRAHLLLLCAASVCVISFSRHFFRPFLPTPPLYIRVSTGPLA